MDIVMVSIQLASSVQGLRRLLKSMSEAPGELKRLLDLLDQLELFAGPDLEPGWKTARRCKPREDVAADWPEGSNQYMRE
jgi:hypothetical protein